MPGRFGLLARTESGLGKRCGIFRRLKPFHLAMLRVARLYDDDSAVMTRGKKFSKRVRGLVISSKQPPPKYRSAFRRRGKAWFRTAVMAPDFWRTISSNESVIH